MNILTNALPETVEISGGAWPINSDFSIGVRFELLMQDPTLTDEERLGRALLLYYPQLPPDLPAALDSLLWFYSCGRDRGSEPAAPEGAAGSTPQKAVKKAYCFEQDADLIFAAFWEAYGIDLNAVEGLHWWKFRALFKALPSECEFCKVMGYRTADTKGMTKKQKELYSRMKKLYALKNEADVAAAITLAERDRKIKEYVTRRFAEAEAGKN